MGQIIPFITVENAADAIEFYKDVFGAQVRGEITYLDTVPGMGEKKYAGKIGHCSLTISDSIIFVNDYLEDFPLAAGDRIQMVLDLGTEEQLRTAFETLSQEGKVVEELQEVFWGALFGTVKDKFGVTWQIYHGHK